MKNGIIVIDKPSGISSYTVIRKLKPYLKDSKIGHLGTLDPLATGVLPILCGKATRLARFFEHYHKTYRVSMQLGIETDSEDITGTIIQTSDIELSDREITQTLLSFTGEIHQIPPMASAIKVNGKPLYKYFRTGKTVERKSRTVQILSLKILSITRTDKTCVDFEVRCSKGTYIRTLCADFGRKTSALATLTHLCRTESNGFSLSQAAPVESVIESFGCQSDSPFFFPLESLLLHFPSLTPEMDVLEKIKHGCPAELDSSADYVRILEHTGKLCAIYKKVNNTYLPELVFTHD